jgi:cytochrome d ubiquinol oxidase subunit II
MSFNEWLPLIFAVLMGVSVLAYVVLDGYDLGVGILLPFAAPDEQDRMVSSIGPFWDANETWLVLGVGLLLIAFPAAHAIILGALYLPVAVMLIGLMLRGVAFEFRGKAQGWHQALWNRLFFVGSLVAALAQGMMLAGYVTGFRTGGAYWLFSIIVGAGLAAGYMLLGAAWVAMRTTGALQVKAWRWVRRTLPALGLAVAAVSLMTPLLSPAVFDRWFRFPETLAFMLLPLLMLALALALFQATSRRLRGERGRDSTPFYCAVGIFVCAFAGLAYSIFPYVVIDRLTLWQAASHPSALKFVLVGVAVVVPLILLYTIYVYRVFRGKATEAGYVAAGRQNIR